ncbi:MBL fold metallo-hydrolase [Aurantiacibacter gilvus]|uniref:MBL fold metallo-hydrolase n=1 Tax=Aurantiacibacter gilvus TaxID=3139141 RepID=A0ABU9IH58_9SPHN
MRTGLAVLALIGAPLAAPDPAQAQDATPCDYELVVLGAGQDAGAPQIGHADDTGPRLLPSSLALIDRSEGKRYLFDASPAITEQLAMLDGIEPPREGLGVDGVFLTHAHIGHYLGLAYFGREAAGASGVPVFAMPRMIEFLAANGPWSQLVELENISLDALNDRTPRMLPGGLAVTPFAVPHRDEFSETVGLVIHHPDVGSALYLPDIDYWPEEGESNLLLSLLSRVDHVFIDATFWDDNELPGRDMSEIPHPRVTDTMDLLADLPAEARARVHFIHYNHTNPIRDPASAESAEVEARGFSVARRGDRFCL